MIDTTRLQAYVQAMAAAPRESRHRAPQPFITVSREAGAGGRSLAEAVLALMERDGRPLFRGWRIFDQELCEIVARDPKLSVWIDTLVDEKFRTQLEEFLAHTLVRESPQASVLKKMFEVVRTLALGGRTIIVGRAASCVTRDLPAGVHVRLVASKAGRVSALMKRYGVDRHQAERKMAELDDSRARLVKGYFLRDIGDPLLYDAVFNMDALSRELAARLLLAMAEDRVARASPAGAGR